MSLLKFDAGGGLLYKGFFQSSGLNKSLDTAHTVFNSTARFIPNSLATDRDMNVLYVNTELKRADKFEIFIEFYTTLSYTYHCLSGEMTANWWKCPGINFDKNSDNNWIVFARAGTTSSANWSTGWVNSSSKGIYINKNAINTIKMTHIPNTDDYVLEVNKQKVIEWTTDNPYYGTVSLGIGGIYRNEQSFLYHPSATNDYITARSYFKINDAFLPRP